MTVYALTKQSYKENSRKLIFLRRSKLNHPVCVSSDRYIKYKYFVPLLESAKDVFLSLKLGYFYNPAFLDLCFICSVSEFRGIIIIVLDSCFLTLPFKTTKESLFQFWQCYFY